jgi:transcriptional regulator with XRE-family HTH domain
LQLGLSQNRLARKIGIRRENIRDVELCKRKFSVKNFRKILNVLNIDATYLLKKIVKIDSYSFEKIIIGDY